MADKKSSLKNALKSNPTNVKVSEGRTFNITPKTQTVQEGRNITITEKEAPKKEPQTIHVTYVSDPKEETEPKKLGRPLKDPEKGNKKGYCKYINVQVPIETLEKIKIAKYSYNNSLTDYINALIEADLEENMSEYNETYGRRKH